MRLRTRAEIDAEPRTAQFLVTATCPIEGGESPKPLPIHATVEWPPQLEPRNYSHEMCEGQHYRLTRESAERDFGIQIGRAWVCEHMGSICE